MNLTQLLLEKKLEETGCLDPRAHMSGDGCRSGHPDPVVATSELMKDWAGCGCCTCSFCKCRK